MLLMSVAVFLGMMVFFVNTWMSALGNEVQSRFLEREQLLADIQEWAVEYVNGLYGNERLMEDLTALFAAGSEVEYIHLRRENSLGSSFQIRYVPADIKNILLNGRNKIGSVILRSESGNKIIGLQNMDVCLTFDRSGEAENPFGDILVAVCSVRDPHSMGRTMGTMEFWVIRKNVMITAMEYGQHVSLKSTQRPICHRETTCERQQIID